MTNLFCRLEVDDEFNLHRLLYRQVGRFRSLEDPVYVVGGLAVQVIEVHPVEKERKGSESFLCYSRPSSWSKF